MNKIISILLTLILCFAITTPVFADSIVLDFGDVAGKPGDVNVDTYILSADLVVLRKVLLGISDLQSKKTADVNDDGKVNIIDLVKLKKMLAFLYTGKNYPTDRKLKIACVGDSITEQTPGYWSNNMFGLLSTDNYEIKAFGVSGSTALFKGLDYGGVPKAYVDQQKYIDSIEYGADIVIIMLGTNDSKTANWNAYGSDFVNDYINIIKSYQTSPTNPAVFVAFPPTVHSDNATQGINDTTITEEIIPAIKEAASLTGAVTIDVHTATENAAAHFSDGVHPSSNAGRKLIARAMAEVIIADTGRD